MKWGKVIEQNIVTEWAKHYISYKSLKKIIRKLKQIHDSTTRECRDGYRLLQMEFTRLVQRVMIPFYVFLLSADN